MQNQSIAGKSNISRDSQIEQDDSGQGQGQGKREGGQQSSRHFYARVKLGSVKAILSMPPQVADAGDRQGRQIR